MNKYFLSLLVLGTFVAGNAFAQENYKQLHVGDSIPNVKFNEVKNYGNGNRTLEDYKGKYIIIDFWTKYCSSCIAAFPKMQKLQEKFGDVLQIILVTRNSENELKDLFKYSPILKNVKLPFIFSDSILSKVIFPHTVVPHHVWIDKSSKIVAISSGSYATAENISKLIGGDKIEIPSTDPLFESEPLSKNKSLLTINNGLFKDKLRYYYADPYNSSKIDLNGYSLFMDRIDGASNIRSSQIEVIKDEYQNKKDVGAVFYNYSIDLLYHFAYSYFQDLRQLNSGKIMVDNNVPFGPIPSGDPSSLYRWRSKNSLCYEARFPNFSLEQVPELLKTDLSRFLGVSGQIVQKPLKCWVLYKEKENSRLYAKGDEPSFSEQTEVEIQYSNRRFGDVVWDLQLANDLYNPSTPVIIDSTNISENTKVNILFGIDDFNNIERLRQCLIKYGLNVKEETKLLKVLELKRISN